MKPRYLRCLSTHRISSNVLIYAEIPKFGGQPGNLCEILDLTLFKPKYNLNAGQFLVPCALNKAQNSPIGSENHGNLVYYFKSS